MLIASNFPQRLLVLLKFETEPWTNHHRLTAADGDPGSDIINEGLLLQTIDGQICVFAVLL